MIRKLSIVSVLLLLSISLIGQTYNAERVTTSEGVANELIDFQYNSPIKTDLNKDLNRNNVVFNEYTRQYNHNGTHNTLIDYRKTNDYNKQRTIHQGKDSYGRNVTIIKNNYSRDGYMIIESYGSKKYYKLKETYR